MECQSSMEEPSIVTMHQLRSFEPDTYSFKVLASGLYTFSRVGPSRSTRPFRIRPAHPFHNTKIRIASCERSNREALI